ncbi:MAG: 3-phosphoshikimate 1-carboxyvinyltransferase [Bacteroidales bacterium]|nr:3-phosphoshikimate 1-carboxyvinyltransferase [Bacteroidales bacterium]
MAVRFFSGRISGNVIAPPSKSSMQRAIAAALLSEGRSVINCPSFSDDSISVMKMASSLGAIVEHQPGRVIITGGIRPIRAALNCGESGLALRMFSAIASSASEYITIEGTGTLRERPVGMIEEPLRQLGVSVETTGGFLPVRVRGPIRGGEVTVDGSLSSQFLTGLLFALPIAEQDSIVRVLNPTSKPYIDLTINVLSHFGIRVENSGYTEFRIEGRQKYVPSEYTVEGDWSGASFLLVMAALGGEVRITNLDKDSAQADKKILDALKLAGAEVILSGDSIVVKKGYLNPFSINISDCPDLAPPLAVLAAGCDGVSTLYGTERLKVKESSRGDNLAVSLVKLGAAVKNSGDTIEIASGGMLTHNLTSSFGDHRMAMAMATASVISENGVSVDDISCISKSYPGFTDDFRQIGGNFSISNDK